MAIKQSGAGNWVEIELDDGTSIRIIQSSKSPPTEDPDLPTPWPKNYPFFKTHDQGNHPLEHFGFEPPAEPARRVVKCDGSESDWKSWQPTDMNVTHTGYYIGTMMPMPSNLPPGAVTACSNPAPPWNPVRIAMKAGEEVVNMQFWESGV